MIKQLLYKEFKLVVHPTLYVFILLGSLVLVPAYPYGVIFFFGCMAVYFTLLNGRENQDILFTILLPVKKRAVVQMTMLLFLLTQLGQLAISVPFAFLRPLLIPDGNPVGIEANVAFYGFGLLIYGLFNLTFLPLYFRDSERIGRVFVISQIGVIFLILIMEMMAHIPGLKWIDALDAASLTKQLPILIVGGLVYVVATFFSYHQSVKNFEAADIR